MRPAYLIVLVIGVTTRLALGQVSHDAADALRDLAERYRACKAVRVDVSSVYTGGGTTFRSAGRHAVLADGRLASRDWAGFSGPVQGVWETTPTSYKFRLANSLVLPHTARLYMQLGAGDFEDGRLPQDFQAYLQAPWPVLPAWCEALASKDDLVFRHESGGFSASSEALGLSLRWNREGQLLGVRVGTAGAWREHEYGNFGAAPFYPPARSVQRIHAGRRERPELVWTYERVEYNPPDAEGAVSPDGLIAKLERFDPADGNVYRADGSFRYNEPELMRTLELRNSFGPWWAILLWIGVAGAAVLSCRALWKRGKAGLWARTQD